MGMLNSKESRKVDTTTSNESLPNLRNVTTEKTKWKVFKKKDTTMPVICKPLKGCVCGNSHLCKQKVTPNGVTIHYPQKRRVFTSLGIKHRLPLNKEKSIYTTNARTPPQVKVVRQRKFPTWRLDRITYNYNSPCYNPVIVSPRPSQ